MRRRDERPERPPELDRFRLADWYRRGSESAVGGSADPDGDEWPTDVIADAWDRYSRARREWAEAHGDSTLAEHMERRRAKPAEWAQAERDAGGNGITVSMRAETSEEKA